MIKKTNMSGVDFHQLYVLDKHLGAGSYSIVKQAINRKTGSTVAAKVIEKNRLSRSDRLALRQEVAILTMLQHPNIMRLEEVIEDEKTCYLITEHMKDGDLFEAVVAQSKFPEAEAQRIIAAVTDAVAFCHANNIVHRDVKPENVLLDGDVVKLADFGFAKKLSWNGEELYETCGTPGYAAPELLSGQPYGKAVDVFSLGVVMYILLSGCPPFPMKMSKVRYALPALRFPSREWENISSDAKELITKMLAKDPKDRISTEELQCHPWIVRGKQKKTMTLSNLKILTSMEEKRSLQEKINGFLIVLRSGLIAKKHGRNGSPHYTRLVLKKNGELHWQSKFAMRKVNHHQPPTTTTTFNNNNNNILGQTLYPLVPLPQVTSSQLQTKESLSQELPQQQQQQQQQQQENDPTVITKLSLHTTDNSLPEKVENLCEMNSTVSKDVVVVVSSSKDMEISTKFFPKTLRESFYGNKKTFIHLADVTQVVIGNSTKVFERAIKSANYECCFSLITRQRTLDLEVQTKNQRDLLILLFEQLLAQKNWNLNK